MIRGWRVGLATAFLLDAAMARAGSPTDPVNVAQQMETALNSGNVDAFLAWFSPQGKVVERGGSTYKTKDEIRAWAQALVAHNYRATSGRHVNAAGRVSWEAKVEFDDLQALGVQSADSRGEATIADGKIQSFTPPFNPGAVALLTSSAARLLGERVRAFIEAAFSLGRLEAADEFFSAQLVDHNPLPGGFPTLEGLRAGIAALRVGFPDLKATVDEVIASGDRVMARVSFTGTHQGPYLGVKATFRRVAFSSVDVFRLEDGKISEHWGLVDTASLNRQLGVVDGTATGTAKHEPVKQGKKGGNGGILGWLF